MDAGDDSHPGAHRSDGAPVPEQRAAYSTPGSVAPGGRADPVAGHPPTVGPDPGPTSGLSTAPGQPADVEAAAPEDEDEDDVPLEDGLDDEADEEDDEDVDEPASLEDPSEDPEPPEVDSVPDDAELPLLSLLAVRLSLR